MSHGALVLVTNPGESAIATYGLEGATLEPLAVTGGLPGTGTFAIDEQRDLVYAGVKGEPAGIQTLALDRASGVLTPLSRLDVESSMTYLALAARGRLLLGASYGGGFGAVWPVDETGRLGDPVARIAFPNLHCVVATDRHAYFVSLGADLIAQYALADDGTLTPLDPPTVAAPAGSGPRHLVLSPDGSNAYLLTEFSGEAIHFTRDVASGVLTRAESVPGYDTTRGLGHSVFGADPLEHHYIWGADLHLTPDGRRLVCSERTESTLTTLDVAGDGTLLDQLAVNETERQPRGFALSADGGLVIAVGERSTRIALSRLEEDGSLTPLTSSSTGTGANWVRVIPRD
ncbi:6-phosphogluconolactonase [Raineyella antarctica]|uniref:6-phosphogluconolactonase n=1 Tax=Raineyella antarctica TaxID=1577474 RepID=A0A1G6GIC4_9ACTN|nr:beta-propeller fold lactonase family protein [Raineyella antarctica]SDB81704.1 6-phosphogluconolactonase [Raineyella antarctica]